MENKDMKQHTETIRCPKCGHNQVAKVDHTQPFYSYAHECSCGYWITESEWESFDDKSFTKTLIIYSCPVHKVDEIRGTFDYNSPNALYFEGIVNALRKAYKDCEFSIRYV